MSYKFHDDVAIADVAFEATGKTLEELFESCARATTVTMVKDLKTVKKTEKKEIKLKHKELDRLLHNFLQEVIFYKDADMLLFSEYNLKIDQKDGYSLSCTCKGEKLDMKKHELLVDVKAVSWHMFRLEKTSKGWQAFIILDV